MIKMGRWRMSASAFAVATGAVFVWVTIKALQADPDNLLLMLWALSFVASIAASGTAIYMYTCSGTRRSSVRIRADTDVLVAMVNDGLARYPIE